MKILQSRSFERKVKKFGKQEKKALDKQILKIAENPSVGAEKKGDLRGVYVHKFKIKNTQYLLSYRFIGADLEPQKRAHSPQLAAGLASESENSKFPYGRRFPAASCGELQLIMIGPHENYYRDLKNYLKAR